MNHDTLLQKQPATAVTFVENHDLRDGWRGAWVTTQWRNARFTPLAWWSKADLNRPEDQSSAADGRAQFYAPPRGYVVYVLT